jgi:hypothetical protein
VFKLAVAAALGAAALAAGAQAASTPPPTLSGETFAGTGTGTTSAPDDPLCNSYIDGSSQTFSVSGVAAGPYPGTFTETGTFSGTFPTTFEATFTIVSGETTITGTKSGSFVGGSCAMGFPHATMVVTGGVPYTASIATAAGDYADQGTATTTATLAPDDTASVDESFVSSLTQPILVQACQPGHGYGDRNHCHDGPPGLDG